MMTEGRSHRSPAAAGAYPSTPSASSIAELVATRIRKAACSRKTGQTDRYAGTERLIAGKPRYAQDQVGARIMAEARPGWGRRQMGIAIPITGNSSSDDLTKSNIHAGGNA